MKLRRQGFNVIEMWEHEFATLKRNGPQFQSFLKEHKMAETETPRFFFRGKNQCREIISWRVCKICWLYVIISIGKFFQSFFVVVYEDSFILHCNWTYFIYRLINIVFIRLDIPKLTRKTLKMWIDILDSSIMKLLCLVHYTCQYYL